MVAEAIRKKGVLTVAVVTKPFRFEGEVRMEVAEQGISALEKHVDTLIVIPNQNLFKIATEKTSVSDAFHRADNVLFAGVRGVTDLMVKPGLINLDFADFRSVMTQTGKAIMGAGEADGPQRAVNAAEAAMANPLLEDSSVDGARGVLINVTGGRDLTLFELDEAVESVRTAEGSDLTARVARRDGEYLHGYTETRSQWAGWVERYGVDFEVPESSRLLLLTGRIAWYDSTVVYSLHQNGRTWGPLRLENEHAGHPRLHQLPRRDEAGEPGADHRDINPLRCRPAHPPVGVGRRSDPGRVAHETAPGDVREGGHAGHPMRRASTERQGHRRRHEAESALGVGYQAGMVKGQRPEQGQTAG